MDALHRTFNIIGWVAFLFLIPIALTLFGITGPGEFFAARLGTFGSPLFFLIYFYFLLFLRLMFGSDQLYTPVIVSFLVSFLLFSASVRIGFMGFFYELTHSVSWFSHDFLNFAAGIIVIFLGMLLSLAKKNYLILDILILVVIPIAFVVCADIFRFLPFAV